jgi:hypothetical protein
MFKVFANGRFVKFDDMEKALAFCNEVFQKVNIILAIEAA